MATLTQARATLRGWAHGAGPAHLGHFRGKMHGRTRTLYRLEALLILWAGYFSDRVSRFTVMDSETLPLIAPRVDNTTGKLILKPQLCS